MRHRQHFQSLCVRRDDNAPIASGLTMDSEQSDWSTDDLSSLIDAVAYFGQQLGGMREKPPEEQVAFLQALGLPPRITAEILERFENTPVYFHRNVPDIGQVAPLACP